MELKNVTFLVIGELYLAINTNLESKRKILLRCP